MRRVVVTGLGPISPIAAGKDAYWRALREGKNGIGPITTFELGDCPVTFLLIIGEVVNLEVEDDCLDKKFGSRCG